MNWNQAIWQRRMDELPEFLEPLVAGLGRRERRQGVALYVQGLLAPGERKSIEPMAQRLRTDSQRLQQLLTDSPWDPEAIWGAIRREVVPVMEPLSAWIIDESGWLKQGNKSVGVAHQYCGAVGKQANCQVSVELTVSDGEIAAPVAARLYLPKEWSQDKARCQGAGIPEEKLAFKTKPELALELIKAALQDGLCPAPVLGDEAFGMSGDLRRGLRQLGLEYLLHGRATLLAWTKPVQLQRTKKHWRAQAGSPAPEKLMDLAKALTPSQFHPVAWRAADGTKRHSRIAWQEIYLLNDLDPLSGQVPPTWLVVDWPPGEPEPFRIYVGAFKTAPTALRRLRLSRGRFAIEQFFQRLKSDLGLDQYEGRSWRGFHHHLVLAAVAYLFVMVIYLRSKKKFWCYVGGGAASDAAVVDSLNRTLPLLQTRLCAGGYKLTK
jgi:SRSO17 transposase